MRGKKNRVRGVDRDRAGFSLIVTVTVMILLSLIAVGLLSLSTTVLRSATSDRDRQLARSNARLALMLAMGELQKYAGPDTRITAPSESLAGVNGSRFVTGAWRSWEGEDHDPRTGQPLQPDYDSKVEPYDSDNSLDGRFLGWLLSGPEQGNGAESPPKVSASGKSIPILGPGTLGKGTGKEVHLEPTTVGEEGAYAWWVEGENVKSLITHDGEELEEVEEWAGRLASYGQPRVESFGLADSVDLASSPSRKTLDLADSGDEEGGDEGKSEGVGKYFHELSVRSRGLLTNSANGGWRRDLSLLTEQWLDVKESLQGPGGTGLFTLAPGVEAPMSTAGLIYPWGMEQDYLVIGSEKNNNISEEGGPSSSWDALVDFAGQYKEAQGGAGVSSFSIRQGGRDEVARRPIITRFHWVYSFGSERQGDGQYRAFLNVNPVFTFWNPYNVEIEDFDPFDIRITEPMPYGLRFKVGNTVQNAFFPLDKLARDGELTMKIQGAGGEPWQPGEARLYSATRALAAKIIRMERGFRTDTGLRIPLFRSYESIAAGKFKGVDELVGAGADRFSVEVQKYDDAKFTIECYKVGGHEMSMEMLYVLPQDLTDSFWPALEIVNDSVTLRDVDGGVDGGSPFLVSIMQHRGVFIESDRESTSTRGYSDNKFFVNFTSPNTYKTNYTPENYPDGFPYDWLFFTPNDIIDTEGMPQAAGSDTDIGYVGTGFRADTGLTSLVTAELPSRPLSSLGELQHFDISSHNPFPPYTSNAVGNSSATFAIAPDKVYSEEGAPEELRTGFDHSYVSNHLFFDDWFVSSIAPDVVESRTTKDVYNEFLTGERDLPNHLYRPAEVQSSAKAKEKSDGLLGDDKAWAQIASELEVEGMFNVNSTSVEAWSALLKHLQNASVPQIVNEEDSWSIELGEEEDHPVTRTTITGDANGQIDTDISQLASPSRFTDQQIDALAEEIVLQVKERGPFLSLSEFVNRRLTTEEDANPLGLAGAIETALVRLSDRPEEENPFNDLQEFFTARVNETVAVDRPFNEAAQGYRAYGFPGWARQADILRPLAPILSVRDDTFVIRAYGESRDSSTGTVMAQAWCEAVVQRRADYLDPNADEATVLPSEETLNSKVNQRFGRRFSMVSFRWLAPGEV
ncbi:MAG: pilus assembly PilX family protein [Roseibacillus sp.]